MCGGERGGGGFGDEATANDKKGRIKQHKGRKRKKKRKNYVFSMSTFSGKLEKRLSFSGL